VTEPKFESALEYVPRLSGILVEKRLKSNGNFIEYESSEELTEQFDLIVPQKEFKLVVKLADSEGTITVYYETRLSLYEVAIVPGMRITMMNLIRKYDRVYKLSSYLQASFNQNLNFSSEQIAKPVCSNLKLTQTIPQMNVKKKTTLYENFVKMSTIYDCFYKNYCSTQNIE
jgi:hypothetical protein